MFAARVFCAMIAAEHKPMSATSLSRVAVVSGVRRRIPPARMLPRRLRVAVSAILLTVSAAPTRTAIAQTAGEDIFKDGFDPPPPPPVNDTCESATTLLLSTPVSGTTTGATNNYDSGLETCTGYTQAGGDVAYSVLLFSGQTVTVTLSNVYPALDASISLLGPGMASVCNAVPVTCLAGADANAFGGGETFSYPVTQTGTYYIIVDSFYTGSKDTGPFTIQVTQP